MDGWADGELLNKGGVFLLYIATCASSPEELTNMTDITIFIS